MFSPHNKHKVYLNWVGYVDKPFRYQTALFFLSVFSVSCLFHVWGVNSQLVEQDTFLSPMNVEAFEMIPSPEPEPVITEKQQILAYLVEKFGDRSADAITMIRQCENSSFDPRRVSPLNIQQSGRRSYDVGVMQINADELDTKEIEKLKGWKYNIDRGYKKRNTKRGSRAGKDCEGVNESCLH